MAIILDADVIIGGEKGSFDLVHWLDLRAADAFAMAAITIAELWHGVARATPGHRWKRRSYLEAIVSAIPVIPYTEQTAYEHARLWAELEAEGKMIGHYDLIVAATAMEHGYQVATFNTRHFGQIRRLHLIKPE